MTAAIVGLVTCYVVLAILLLSLNLKSAWRWPVKAAAITVTAAFFVIAFLAIEAMLGWPTAGAPPEHFQLHAAVVREPDPQSDHPGTIYLWLTARGAEGFDLGPPRAHALPYSRELHKKVVEARSRLEKGRPVEGRALHRARPGGGHTESVQLELFEAPPAVLPPKAG